MIGIIVVFPKKENAINIRNLLVRNGVNVTGVATIDDVEKKVLALDENGESHEF